MKIYTKTGDNGNTGLFGGQRIAKSALRLHVYGTIDELNSHIGLALSLDAEHPCGIELSALLTPIQHELFVIGSHVSTPYSQNTIPDSLPHLDPQAIVRLEEQIDILTAQLQPLKTFILPGGSTVASQLHICRTVTRRAERYAVELSAIAYVMPQILIYLNRLSDFFFTLARAANNAQGIADTAWRK